MDTVSRRLTASERVAEVILLLAGLTLKEATIPVLREAAGRYRPARGPGDGPAWAWQDHPHAPACRRQGGLDTGVGLLTN
jgi:hypothetical protein